MSAEYFDIYEEYGLKHFQLPKVFFTSKRYKSMTNDDKVAWAILRDRFNISKKNKWYDEQGRIFFQYSNDSLKEILNCHSQKLAKIKKNLIELDLIESVRTGRGLNNKLYLKKPIVDEEDIYNIDKQENETEKNDQNLTPPSDVRKSNVQTFENQTSGHSKIKRPDVRKSNSSNTDLSNTDLSNTDLSNQSIKEHIHLLSLPDDIKITLNKHQKRLIDDNISLNDIESNYKAHEGLLTVGEYQSALNFVLAKFERPIASIEAAMRTAITKKLELREKANQSNKSKQDTMPKWYREDKDESNNQDVQVPETENETTNLENEREKFKRLLEERKQRNAYSSSMES